MEARLTDGSRERRPDHEQREVDKLLLNEDLLRPDDGEADHDEAEAKDADETNLLLQRDANIVDQPEGHGHNCNMLEPNEHRWGRGGNVLQRSVKTSMAVL